MNEQNEIVEIIKNLVEEVSLGSIKYSDIFDTSKLLDDLGLDSLDYATVMLRVEQKTGIHIAEDSTNWADVQTVEQLAQLFLANK